MQTGAETKPIIQLTTNKRSKNDPSIRIPENIPEAQIKKKKSQTRYDVVLMKITVGRKWGKKYRNGEVLERHQHQR